jgi:iron complex outermembrane recepter protein
MKTLLSAVVATTLALCTIEAAADTMPGERKVALTIESTNLAAALDKWAQQSGFQIFVDKQLASNLVAPNLNGTYTAQEALEKLLAGTPLTYIWINERAVSIRKKSPRAVPAALQRTGLEGQQSAPVAKFGSDSAPSSPSSRSAQDGESPWASSVWISGDDAIEEVLVTGSHIHGVATPAPIIRLGRAEIERTGFSVPGDLIRNLPQNFSGGNNPQVTVGAAPGGTVNQSVSGGSAPNLRGLGPGSTLTLVNGHRLGSDYGGFADISLIPLGVIDHVDVLTDSGSSAYGSDAVAGVVNFVLRRPSRIARTDLVFGAATEGGGTERLISQLFGTTWDGGGAQFSYEHATQDAVSAADRDFAADVVLPFALLPASSRDSFFVGAEQSFTPNLSWRFDGLFTTRVFDNSNALAPGIYVSAHNAVKQYVAATEFEFALANDWRMTAAFSSADQDTSARQLISIGIPFRNDFGGYSRSAELTGTGPLFSAPGGLARLALGAGYRPENYWGETIDASGTTPEIDERRNVRYAFGEVAIPFLSEVNGNGEQRLELTLSARHDEYSDFGGETVPKAGIAYSPIRQLRLRGTWGKSFRAPTLLDAYGPRFVSVQQLEDPLAPTGTSLDLVLDGSNQDLKPERAESWTFGVDYAPEGLEGLRVSATYFDIDYTNRLGNIPITATALTIPEHQTFVQRDPTQAEQQSLIDSATGGFFNFTDQPYDPANIAAVINGRRMNVSHQEVSGVDLIVDSQISHGAGATSLFLNGSYLEIREQFTPLADEQQIAGRSFNPPQFRANGGVTWSTGSWSATATVHYLDAAINTYTPTPTHVASWTTLDMQLAYTSSRVNTWLSGVRTAIAVRNVFDEDPPYTEADSFRTGFHYDSLNASPLGRFVSVQFAKTW